MTSTQYSIGLSGDRNSSRVLKAPGGGHTNIFGESTEMHVPSPRPKYDQQNSSNLNFCMNTIDPNLKVESKKADVVKSEPAKPVAAPAEASPKPSTPPAAAVAPSPPASANGSNGHSAPAPQAAPISSIPSGDGPQARGGNRVPPGGFSSGGFW